MDSLFTVQGFSFAGSGQNTGIAFVKLKDWDERDSDEAGVTAIAGRAMGAFIVRSRTPWCSRSRRLRCSSSARSAASTSSSWTCVGAGHEALVDASNQLLAAAARSRRC